MKAKRAVGRGAPRPGQPVARARPERARARPGAGLAYARKSLELADTPAARRFAVEVLWKGPIARITSPTAVPALSPKMRRLARPARLQPRRRVAWIPQHPTGRALLLPRDGGTPRFLHARRTATRPRSRSARRATCSSLRRGVEPAPSLPARSARDPEHRAGRQPLQGLGLDGALFTATSRPRATRRCWSGRGPFRPASGARSHGSTGRVSSTGRSTGRTG